MTPAHCRVTGLLSPEIAFEVSLPAKWNGRFYMIGNGGLAGEAMDDPGRVAQRNAALQVGFAFAQTNTGHDARKEPSGSFVLSNPEKATDYAWRAVHLTAVTTRHITKDYYGKPISRAYWNSCSNGGRQGLLEAQRFPQDFDGVIANSPWVDQTGFTVGAMWNQKALPSAAPALTPAKLGLVGEKVMAKCDAVDGIKDWLIDDPRKCDFDPTRDIPVCAAGTDGENCLTAFEAEAMAKVYGGPVSNELKPIFPGYMVGSEAVVTRRVWRRRGSASGWMKRDRRSPTGPQTGGLQPGRGDYAISRPPSAPGGLRLPEVHSTMTAMMHLLDDWGKQADATNPDLSKFRKRGGKLIVTYGWADTILQPMMGVDYYEQALAKNGSDTPEFFRLFMAPGMGHCGGGIGPDRHDSMTAMVNWVEKGKAPDSMIASRVAGGSVVRTRPLCVYPQVSRYSGTGSIDDAANFRCVAP